MRFLAILLSLCVLVLGCSRGGGMKSVTGNWTASSGGEKASLVFAEDGTMYLLVGDAQGVAGEQGTYEQKPDRIDLRVQPFGSGSKVPLSVKYRWLGPDKIVMSSDADPKETIYVREGAAPKTATLPKLNPGLNAGSGMSEADRAKSQDEMYSRNCLSNLKQLGLGMQLYATDYDDMLPDSGGWASGLYPYSKSESMFSCPQLAATNRQGGYAMDSRLSQARTKSIATPEDVILLFESATESIGASDPQTSFLVQPRHAGTISVTYLDGHATGMKR